MWEESTSEQTEPQSSTKKTKFRLPNTQMLIITGGGVLIIVLVIISGFFFIKYQNAQKLSKLPQVQNQVADLIAKIGKSVDLPKNETPTVATVTDKFKLAGQPFFARAENGDQVLIYPKNHIGVLYRPSTDKIINFATNVTVGGVPTGAPTVAGASTSPSEAPSPTQKPTPTVVKEISPTDTPTVSPTP